MTWDRAQALASVCSEAVRGSALFSWLVQHNGKLGPVTPDTRMWLLMKCRDPKLSKHNLELQICCVGDFIWKYVTTPRQLWNLNLPWTIRHTWYFPLQEWCSLFSSQTLHFRWLSGPNKLIYTCGKRNRKIKRHFAWGYFWFQLPYLKSLGVTSINFSL